MPAQPSWTAAGGLRRAMWQGALAAAGLCAALAMPAWAVPTVTTHFVLRGVIAFAVAWVLFSVVHRAAGMVGPHCTAIVIALTALVLFSTHLIYAVHGIPLSTGTWRGWSLLHPLVLLTMNIWPLAFGAGLCAWMRHNE